MLFSIQHKTELGYSQKVSESVVEVRVTPRSDSQQTLRHFHLAVAPDARTAMHLDWQGNEVHQFSIVPFHNRVVVVSNATVEVNREPVDLACVDDPIKGKLESPRLLDFLTFQGPISRHPRVLELGERIRIAGCRRGVDALLLVTERVREVLAYRRGVTNSFTTAVEALEQGAGVCQDFAHIGIALLRLVGVPCRYVSGYLYRPDMPEVETHAWCEAFLPSAGWVGFDPTHGELVGPRHVAVAVGRSYADVPPNRGVFRGEAEESIEVSVSIRQVDAAPAHSPFAVPFHQSNQADLPPLRRPGAHSYNLEQQLQQQHDRSKAQVQQQRQQQQAGQARIEEWRRPGLAYDSHASVPVTCRRSLATSSGCRERIETRSSLRFLRTRGRQ
jgi:transglutaminase-like putative cysteine protease